MRSARVLQFYILSWFLDKAWWLLDVLRSSSFLKSSNNLDSSPSTSSRNAELRASTFLTFESNNLAAGTCLDKVSMASLTLSWGSRPPSNTSYTLCIGSTRRWSPFASSSSYITTVCVFWPSFRSAPVLCCCLALPISFSLSSLLLPYCTSRFALSSERIWRCTGCRIEFVRLLNSCLRRSSSSSRSVDASCSCNSLILLLLEAEARAAAYLAVSVASLILSSN